VFTLRLANVRSSSSKPKFSPNFAADNKVSSLLPTPLYTQIKRVLREMILAGVYKPHQQMPSESEMIESFQVSRITIRQALNDLQNEGLIFRIHGKGTFVSKPKAFQDLTRLQGFSEAMRQMGYETFAKVLSCKTISPSPQVQERLRLGKRAKVTELKRLRYLNREPISVDVSYLPAAIGARLSNKDLASRDVFAILENDLGIALGHADLQIGSALADENFGHLLGLEEGAPVLTIERTTHDQKGQPIDFEHLYYRGDAFQYRVRVERVPLNHN
jgi:GntR family transcriptional regulator